MTRRCVAVGVMMVVAVSAACRDERPVPLPPPAEATPSAGRLKPMTSRDGAATPSTPPASLQALPPGHPPIAGGAPAGPVSGAAVKGRVTITPRLKNRQGRAVYIIARNARSGQILAVRKEEDVRFPMTFEISGADAMVEGTAFVGPFDITARLSKTGDATPGAGDVEGTAKGVAAAAKDVTITLDAVRQ